MAYAAGLLGFILIKVLVPAFTAREDMKTHGVTAYGVYAIVVELGLSLALVAVLAHGRTRAGPSIERVFQMLNFDAEEIY